MSNVRCGMPLAASGGLRAFLNRTVVLIVLGAALAVPALAAASPIPVLKYGQAAASDSSGAGSRVWATYGPAGPEIGQTLSSSIAVDDGLAAAAYGVAAGGTSDYLNVTNFGFAIPDAAIVDGIEVIVDKFQWQGSPAVRDHTVQLLKSGVRSGDNKALTDVEWPYSTTTTYGTGSLWGESWSAAAINRADFGVSLAVFSPTESRTAAIDYVAIRVTYHLPGGPSLAQTATSQGPGNKPWVNLDNIKNDDAQYASIAGLGQANYSEFLRATDLGFEIPATATIQGIQVVVDRYASAVGVRETDLRLVRDGAVAGDSKASTAFWPASATKATYGTGTLWGTTWTPDDLNADDFGVSLKVYNASGEPGTTPYGPRDVYVDCIQVTVTYTMPGGGPLMAQTATSNGGGSKAWVGLGNISTDNGQYAYANNIGSTNLSDFLHATNFGFEIPERAIVDSIKVAIDRSASGAGVKDEVVQLVKAGSRVGTNKADPVTVWPTTDAVASYGEGTLWGTTWTPDEVNSSSFGAALQVRNTATGGGSNRTANVDYVQMTVLYTVPPDDTPPTINTFTINDDDDYTTSTSVTLQLDAEDDVSGLDTMSFSNDNSTWSTPEAYAATKSWTLAAGADGSRTVYVKVTDKAGNESTASDTIVLDTTAPTTLITVVPADPNGESDWYTSVPTVELSTEIGAQTYYRWGVSGDLKSLAINGQPVVSEGESTLYYYSVDAAGNTESPAKSKAFKVDTTDATINTFTINDDDDYTTSTSVTLQLDAEDSGSGLDKMSFSNDNSTWSTPEAYTTSKSWTLAAGADGSRTVYVKVTDKAGNETTTSDTIVLDTTKPVGSIEINDDDEYTNSTTVDLTLSAADAGSDVDKMRFSNDGSSWSGWEDYDTTKSWTLAAGADGSRTVYAQFRDGAGNVSDSSSDTIVLDTTKPVGSIEINDDDEYTNSATVDLTLSAADAGSDVDKMRFSNDGSSWSSWEDYATTWADWDLAAGADGSRTVYAQFRDGAGNVSDSSSDTIVLDTTDATINTFTINDGDTYAVATSVVLQLDAEDSGSGLDKMSFSNDNSTWSTPEPCDTTKSWTLAAGADGSRTVYVKVTDKAGNETTTSDTIVLDTTAPTGSIEINDDDEYTNSATVDLTLSAADAGSGVKLMRFSNDDATWSSWEDYATTWANWELDAGADGERTVYVQFMDGAGYAQMTAGAGYVQMRAVEFNVSASSSDAIVLDTTDATINTFNINDGDTYTTSTSVTLQLDAADDVSGLDTMSFSNDNSTWSTPEAYDTTKSWTLAAGADGSRTVYVKVTDKAGNETTTSDTIVLDTTKPATASVSVPASGAFYGGTTAVPATFSGSAADNAGGSGLAENSTTFTIKNPSGDYWNGSGWQDDPEALAATHNATSGNTSAAWTDDVAMPDWTAVSEGTYEVQATAIDRAGNAFSGTAVQFVVDRTDPAVATVTRPADESAFRSSSVPGLFEGGAADNAGGSGLLADSATFTLMRPDGDFWTGSGWQATPFPLATAHAQTSDGTSVTWSDDVDMPKWSSMPEGTYTVQATVVDRAGNTHAGKAITFSLDRSDPTVASVTTPADGDAYRTSTVPALLKGSAADNDGGGGLDANSTTFTLERPDGKFWNGSGWTGSAHDLATTHESTTGDTEVDWEDAATLPDWSTAPEGIYTVQATATDKVGNTYTGAAVSFGIDRSNPAAASVTSPADDEVYGTDSMPAAFEGAAADNAGGGGLAEDSTEFTLRNPDGDYWTGSSWQDAAAWLTTTHNATTGGTSAGWSRDSGLPNWGESADGDYTVQAKATDKAGNTFTGTAITFMLDNNGPSGSIVINGDDEFTTSGTATLALSASDDGTGVDDMRFSNDGSTWSDWEDYKTSRTGWSLASGVDGQRTVYAQFRDKVGNVSASASDSIALDTTAPTGSIVIEDGAQYATSRTVALTLSASDGGTGVDKMRFSNDGSTWSSWEDYTSSRAGWALPDDANVEYTVYAQFRDKAGFESDVYSDSILTDTIAPPMGVLSVTSRRHDRLTISWPASVDDESGLVGYRVWVSGYASFMEFGTSVTLYDLDPQMTYTINVVAVDNAGNESAISSVSARTTITPGPTPDPSTAPTTPAPPSPINGSFGVPGSGNASFAFEDVTEPGELTIRLDPYPIDSSTGSSYVVVGDMSYHINFTGTFKGTVTLTLPYDPALPDVRAAGLLVRHLGPGGWETITPTVDVANQTVTFTLTSLSPVLLVEPAGADKALAMATSFAGELQSKTIIKPVHGASVTLVAQVKDAGGFGVASKDVWVQQYAKGAWEDSAKATAADKGSYTFATTANSKGVYRFVVRADKLTDEVVGAAYTVYPRAAVALTSAPKAAKSGARFTVKGKITPGSVVRGKVVLKFYRLVGGKYVYQHRMAVKVGAKKGEAGAVTFSSRVRLAKAGKWRVIAQTADTATHTSASSAHRSIRVR